MKNFIFIFALLGLTIGTPNKSISQEAIGIDLSKIWNTEGFVKLSEVATSVEYIPLETTKKSILGNESNLRVKISADRIFVTQRENSVKVFNREGKYLFNLGGYGKGPEEYLSATLYCDEEREIVYIMDNDQDKILKFGFDGKLIGNYRIGADIIKITLLENGNIVALNLPHKEYKNKKASVQFFDENMNIEKEIEIYTDFKPGAGARYWRSCSFTFIDNEIHFIENPFRRILALDSNDKWYEKYTIEQGKSSPSEEEYYQGTVDKNMIMSISQFPNYLFISGLVERTGRLIVFEKSSQTIKMNHMIAETLNTRDISGFLNDIDGGLPFRPGGTAGENQYATIYNAQRFIDLGNGDITHYYAKQDTPLSGELKTFCKTLTPDDNPVIMIAKFK